MSTTPLGGAALAGVVLAAAMLAGCTGEPEEPPAPAPTSSAAPSSSPAVLPRPTPTPAGAPARLGCDDGTTAISGAPTKASQWRLGLWAENWLGDRSEPAPGPVQFWKGFLYVAPTAAKATTIRVESPRDARLYYVPFAWWSQAASGGVPRLTLYDPSNGRREIAFGTCPKAVVGYTGGVQTAGPACVTLVVQAGRRTERVTLPLGASC